MTYNYSWKAKWKHPIYKWNDRRTKSSRNSCLMLMTNVTNVAMLRSLVNPTSLQRESCSALNRIIWKRPLHSGVNALSGRVTTRVFRWWWRLSSSLVIFCLVVDLLHSWPTKCSSKHFFHINTYFTQSKSRALSHLTAFFYSHTCCPLRLGHFCCFLWSCAWCFPLFSQSSFQLLRMCRTSPPKQ